MYRATLIKGETFRIGNYKFNINNGLRSQIISDSAAEILRKNTKFKVVKINEQEYEPSSGKYAITNIYWDANIKKVVLERELKSE